MLANRSTPTVHPPRLASAWSLAAAPHGQARRSGAVHLKSGRWDWTVRTGGSGTVVVFRHRQRSREEMRSFSIGTDLTGAEVQEIAECPSMRTWHDVGGGRWEVRLEEPTTSRRGETGSSVWLVFQKGPHRRASLIPRETRLGELTFSELSTHFHD